MSIWFVFPANKLTALRNAYAASSVSDGEIIGTVVYNRARTKCFTGSSRITVEQSDSLQAGNAQWLTVTDDPAFMRDSEWASEA
jgi:hypothetical protein|tara:strand:- start:298 stop:549 length:252 start_codon:yes stop_codon:yes gene_type:complete